MSAQLDVGHANESAIEMRVKFLLRMSGKQEYPVYQPNIDISSDFEPAGFKSSSLHEACSPHVDKDSIGTEFLVS